MDLIFQYRKDASWMHRLDPVSKTVWIFAVSLLAFGTFTAWTQGLVFLVCLFFAVALAGLSFRDLWRGTRWLIGACVFFFAVQTLSLSIPGKTEVLRFGGKVIYLETLDYALALCLRIYTVFLSSLVFIRTTHPRDLAVGFIQILKLPYKVPYAFFIALRIIPLIEEEARTITEAHKIRGIGERTGLVSRIENLKRFTIPLLVRSLRSATITTHSMESRGFGAYPQRHYVQEIRMERAGRVLTWSCVALVVLWYALIFAGIIQLKYSVS